MIRDASELPRDSRLDCDVCIVGTGAAGMTLAHELKDAGIHVIVLESGGPRHSKKLQKLYTGKIFDSRHMALEMCRERRFGGTTNFWGGRCAPFDEIDFEKRDYVPYSGWPVSKAEMDPFYARAHEYLDLGDYDYMLRGSADGAARSMIPGLESETVHTNWVWRFSLPTNFRAKYAPRLKQTESVQIILHATVVKLHTTENGDHVTHVEASTYDGKRMHVHPAFVVLAMGGMETVRLLFLSNDAQPEGLGNRHGILGRFYLSHTAGQAGVFQFTPKGGGVTWGYERASDGVYCRRAFAIDPDYLRRHGLMNFRAILTYPQISDPAHRSGVLSAMYLLKRFMVRRVPPEYCVELSGLSKYQHVGGHFRNVLLGLGSCFRFLRVALVERVFARRKLPSLVLEDPRNQYLLHFDAEQRPNPESYVCLSRTEFDHFGQAKLEVHWAPTDEDVESVFRSIKLLAQELERTGTGRLLSTDEELRRDIARIGVGSHYMGMARMADEPEYGVVDRNCRVFGVDNLFLATGATFPTGGYANPTLTIVAMAIRIADHLKDLHRNEASE